MSYHQKCHLKTATMTTRLSPTPTMVTSTVTPMNCLLKQSRVPRAPRHPHHLFDNAPYQQMMHLRVLQPEGPRAKARNYPHLHMIMMKTQTMPARIHKTLMPTIPLCLVGSRRKQSTRQLPWVSECLKRQLR